ncbi:MAG: hypothetical protein AB9917_11700 [Negativicutes bacterium]
MNKNLYFGLIVGLLAVVNVNFAPHTHSGTVFAQQINDNESKTNYTNIGFALMKENIGLISIGTSDSNILKTLGEPGKKSAAQIWGADGMEHQNWFYQTKGIKLGMIQKDGNKIVDRINIISPCDYKTQRGIQIGSRAMDVQMAYKNAINPHDSKPESTIVAGTIYGGIIFGLKDGIVTSIFIGAAAE